MGKETTIIALVGAFIFGMWYFNKNGCDTDIEALCWNGPSIEEMFSGGGKEVEAPPLEQLPANEEEAEAQTEEAGEVAAKRWIEKYPRGIHPATPSKAALAHAYFVNNRISIA